MKCQSPYLFLLGILIFFQLHVVLGFEFQFYDKIKCYFYKCCGESHTKIDFGMLERELKEKLYGQPLVINVVYNAIKGHFDLKVRRKALVMSFHGSAGVGKTFVSQIIAKNLFLKDVKSIFFKKYVATRDFPFNDKIDSYKERLIKDIEETVKKCEFSLFVFDETDKMPIGLLDTIKAYIDFHDELGGVDYRKAIFIFLGNSAAKKIIELTNNLDQKNINRDQFELKDFQNAIQNSVYAEKEADDKGLYRAAIIDGFLVDYFVPFLPLERTHVKKCIKAELLKFDLVNSSYYQKHHMAEDIDKIANEIDYEPPGKRKYSTAGCKRIPNLVRNLIVEKRYQVKGEL